MKYYRISLMVQRVRKGELVEVKSSAEIHFDDHVTLSKVFDFTSSVKAMWKKAMIAGHKCLYYEMEIVESAYDNWLNPDKELVQKEYNRWYCTSAEQDDEGIHLKPDTRYTSESSDIYLSKNTVKDLVSVLP